MALAVAGVGRRTSSRHCQQQQRGSYRLHHRGEGVLWREVYSKRGSWKCEVPLCHCVTVSITYLLYSLQMSQ